MKKLIVLISMMLFGYNAVNAQVMEDDFESNQYNWSELSSKRGKAIIKDGVLHLESASTTGKTHSVMSTCYAPFDINKPFVMTVEALADKIGSNKLFGIILDYEDEQNYILFYVDDDEAKLEVWKEDKLVGYKEEALKLRKGKKVGIDFEVKYNLNELVFNVNGVRAMAYRRRISNDSFLLGTSGIGFYARKGTIDFDNLKIIQ